MLSKKPSVGMVVSLFLFGGFALGIGILPAQGLDASEAKSIPHSSAADELLSSPALDIEFRGLEDDPETKVYEPFVGCSVNYVDGPGAALDRKNMIGPENSVMVSPEEMRSIGRSEAEVQAQTLAWSKLSPEEREEQLCRAAQQNAVIDELR